MSHRLHTSLPTPPISTDSSSHHEQETSSRSYQIPSGQPPTPIHNLPQQYSQSNIQQQNDGSYQSNYAPYPQSSSALGIYASPQSTHPSLPQQSPGYTGTYTQSVPRSSSEGLTYNSNSQFNYGPPSSGAYTGSWSSSELIDSDQADMMATTHQLRTQFPPYATPSSNSPTSISSPQEHHNRSAYRPSYTSSYYPHYQIPGNSQYLHNSGNSTSPYTSQPQVSPQYQSSHVLPSPSSYSPSTLVDQSPRDRSLQAPLQLSSQYMGPPPTGTSKPPGSAGNQHSGVNANARSHQGAAPGPIPATQPVVMQKGPDGQQVIQFEYSRDRVKVMYDINCNIESVDTSKLPPEFKETNAVYPKARVKEVYKGNRWEYEARCNEIGWALAELNPSIRGKRGVIQRAVDSLRNCSKDPQQRSRRVRRLQKITKRQQAQKHNNLTTSNAGLGSIQSVAGANALHGFKQEPLPLPPTQHQIMSADEASRGSVSSSSVSWSPQQMTQSNLPNQDFPPTPNRSPEMQRLDKPQESPTSRVEAKTQYAPYFSERSATSPQRTTQFEDSELFGDMQGTNMSGFLQIKDVEGTVVKVPKVFTSDVIGIVDDWRSKYAVFPHAAHESPTAEQSPLWRPRSVEKRTLPSGKEYEVEVPLPTDSHHKQKQILNEIGYRMSWQRRQEFCDSKSDPQQPRVMFLQRSLNNYRNNMFEQYRKNQRDPPAHFETRPGRPRWHSKTPKIAQATA